MPLQLPPHPEQIALRRTPRYLAETTRPAYLRTQLRSGTRKLDIPDSAATQVNQRYQPSPEPGAIRPMPPTDEVAT